MDEIGYIDWSRAVKVGRGLVPVGRKLPAQEITELVEALRTSAVMADGYVAEVTQLSNPLAAKTLVLDRRSWIEACAASGSAILSRLGATAEPRARTDVVLGTGRGAQLGAAFAAVATRILGQFDPFCDTARLLLVAPNIHEVEKELMVDPQDFRLWVCLHEQTHRYQFGHAAWLREHVLSLIEELVAVDEPFDFKRPIGQPGASIIDYALGPQQRAVFDKISAVMSLAEGHADVMMDRVGTAVVPTLPIIRRAFENRRDRRGWASIIGKLLGNDLKLAQYRDGAAFCRAVIDTADVATLNIAFSEAEKLPTLDEIHDPAAWLARVG